MILVQPDYKDIRALSEFWQRLEPEVFDAAKGDVFQAMRNKLWVYGHDARPAEPTSSDAYFYRAWVIPWGEKRPVVTSGQLLLAAMLAAYTRCLPKPVRAVN